MAAHARAAAAPHRLIAVAVICVSLLTPPVGVRPTLAAAAHGSGAVRMVARVELARFGGLAAHPALGPAARPATRPALDLAAHPALGPATRPALGPAARPSAVGVVEALTSKTSTVVPSSGPIRPVPGMPGPDVGEASTYGPGYAGLIAVPRRGRWLVRITWHGRSLVRRTNDYGPDQRLFPDRVIDLDVATFEALSGEDWTRGILAPVTVQYLRYLGS
jgi:hypothetical protein